MWIVSQIGAREHYAIPRALAQTGQLSLLCTDAWIRPESAWAKLPGTRRLRDRYHPDLNNAPVFAPNTRMLTFEIEQRLRKRSSWETIIARNSLFQQQVIRHLSLLPDPSVSRNEEQGTRNEYAQRIDGAQRNQQQRTIFSYSCAALELFRFAKSRGWQTVLGQIDPGPEEERLVAEEGRRYPALKNTWQPTPAIYWERWHEEVKLADRIIVNSEWSRQCLLTEGVPEEKMEVVPLTVSGRQSERLQGVEPKVAGVKRKQMDNRENRDGCPARASEASKAKRSQWAVGGGGGGGGGGEPGTKNDEPRTLSVLFLGQINLRKGVGRLLDAMRLLKDEPVTLTLAGPAEIEPSAWEDLPQVKWVGVIPRSEVGCYYENADLFILPTISDGYALTQLEALARGLPVMASKSCGAAVTHGMNGWILDDLEPATIARAILIAREALPLARVEMPAFGLDDLARCLVGNRSD